MHNWAEAIKKFYSRAELLAKSGIPLSLAPGFFSSRATSVLLYIAQLALPPECFKNIERGALTKAFKMAPNSLSTSTAYSLNVLGGPHTETLPVLLCCSRLLTDLLDPTVPGPGQARLQSSSLYAYALLSLS